MGIDRSRRRACQVLSTVVTAPWLADPALAQPASQSLIVYLTRTRNTEAVARMIQARTGGHLVELRLAKPYPTRYQAHVDQVVGENETGFLPELADHIDMAPYRTVFLGFPTWDMQLPPPVKSLLAKAKLRGKTVLPFNTHAGYGVGSGFSGINALCPDSTVKTGLSIEGGKERDGVMLAIQGRQMQRVSRQVADWLRGNGLNV